MYTNRILIAMTDVNCDVDGNPLRRLSLEQISRFKRGEHRLRARTAGTLEQHCFGGSLSAGGRGRYSITMNASGSLSILLDTTTGKTWRIFIEEDKSLA